MCESARRSSAAADFRRRRGATHEQRGADMIDIRRLAFIGGGNMAAALIGGLIKRGLPGERIVVADPSSDQLQRLVRDYGVQRRRRQCQRGDRARRSSSWRSSRSRCAPWRWALSPHLAASKPLVISVAAGHSACSARTVVRPPDCRRAHHAQSAGTQRLWRHRTLCAGERRGGQPGARRSPSWPPSAPRYGSSMNRRWIP